MIEVIIDYILFIKEWANNNQWFVAIIIFVLSLFVWRFSGFFKFIKQKPKLKINEYSTNIPSFYVDNLDPIVENEWNEKVERIAFLVWLNIANIWVVPTTISYIYFEYKDQNRKKHKLWCISMPVPLKENYWDNEKIYISLATNRKDLWVYPNWYLWVNTCTQGFVYYNINYYWNYRPVIKDNKIGWKIIIKDINWKEFKENVTLIKRDKKYLSKYINPDKLLNWNSYLE